MKKTLSRAQQIITHLLGSFVLQISLLSMCIRLYDLTWKIYALTAVMAVAIAVLDFFICFKLPYPLRGYYHLADLMMMLPTAAIAGIFMMQMIQRKSAENLPIVLTILLLNVLIIFERILLVKKLKAKKEQAQDIPDSEQSGE